MSKKNKRITIENMLTLATIILILLVWFVVTNFGIANSKMVPTPQAVWNAFIAEWIQKL